MVLGYLFGPFQGYNIQAKEVGMFLKKLVNLMQWTITIPDLVKYHVGFIV